jgi:hypothetical protein
VSRSQLDSTPGVKRLPKFASSCARFPERENKYAATVFQAYSDKRDAVSAVDDESGKLTPRGKAVVASYSTGLLSRTFGTPFQKAARDLFNVAKSKQESRTVLTTENLPKILKETKPSEKSPK